MSLSIREQLEEIITDLNWAITQVKRQHPEDPYLAQYPDGRYILLEALSAKALAVAALANLESQ